MARIKKKHLVRIGYEPGEAIKKALEAMQHHTLVRKGRQFKLGLLSDVLRNPEKYYEHDILQKVAHILAPIPDDAKQIQYPSLSDTPLPYQVYGSENISGGAKQQIDIAARLPIAEAAALMPDAHVGYGLPVGGVLATRNAIIPYAVGVDIGCRMCLTVYNIKPSYLDRHQYQLKQMLKEHTTFGTGKGPANPMDDEVLERPIFNEIEILKNFHNKARNQIGSSGSGNHFVEFGLVDLVDPDNEFGVKPGKYLGILSHSGSRGLGAGIATYYTRKAMDMCKLPREAKNLAWLNMDHELGQEYWQAMNLAGDYASACHNHIHHRLSKALNEKPLFRVENHHNFAWKERLSDGSEVYVHRKGATPAGKGVLGIIPGSMVAPGFIVRGKGNPASLNSASHGAGRALSRRRALNSTTRSALNKTLREHKVTLIGGGLDEAPIAYKNIHTVMSFQRQLVDVLGTFQPKIVRMEG